MYEALSVYCIFPGQCVQLVWFCHEEQHRTPEQPWQLHQPLSLFPQNSLPEVGNKVILFTFVNYGQINFVGKLSKVTFSISIIFFLRISSGIIILHDCCMYHKLCSEGKNYCRDRMLLVPFINSEIIIEAGLWHKSRHKCSFGIVVNYMTGQRMQYSKSGGKAQCSWT